MNQPPDTERAEPDWDDWRDELRGFLRQTINEIRQCVHTLNQASRPAVTRSSDMATAPPPRALDVPTVASNRGLSPMDETAPADSSDRLANLKRQLAEKLSNQPVVTSASDPDVTS